MEAFPSIPFSLRGVENHVYVADAATLPFEKLMPFCNDLTTLL
jgi:hypothetical protein